MTFSTSRIAVLMSCLGFLPTGATAQNVINENTTIRDALCVGVNCFDDEIYGTDVIRLSSNNNRIHFEDLSAPTEPSNDWRLKFNDAAQIAFGAESYFALEDATAGTVPFRVDAGAPSNALYVNEDGKIGIGTSMPGPANVEIVGDSTASIAMFAPTAASGSKLFTFTVSNNGFELSDNIHGTSPLFVGPNVPYLALHMDSFAVSVNRSAEDLNFQALSDDGRALLFTDAGTNNVGIGTSTPEAPLEVGTPDAFAFFRLTADGAATNKSVDFVFTQGPLGTGQLRYNIVEAGDSPQVPEMTLDADGNMTLTGTLTTTGPTCAGGCDRVFDTGYALASIGERTDQMLADGHLPAVGPTVPGAPVNVTEKMGNMLNELEHAHLYIAQLHDRLAEQEAWAAQQEQLADDQTTLIAGLIARLEAVEAR